MGRRSFWLAVVAIALTSCMTTQDAVPEDGLHGGAPIVTQHASCAFEDDTEASASGFLDGFKVSSDGRRSDEPALDPEWELYLPARWNDFWFNLFNGGRRLVVFHQGTIDPYIDPNPKLPNHAFTSYNQVICNLLTSDIAVAWTSSTEHGYDVEGAFYTTLEMIKAIRNLSIPQPDHYHEVGFSQGGLMGVVFATDPEPAIHGTFKSHLSICAPLLGMPKQLEYFGDVRVLFDAYFQANYTDGEDNDIIPLGTNGNGPAFNVPDPEDGLGWDVVHHSNADGTLDFGMIEYPTTTTSSSTSPGVANIAASIAQALWNDHGLATSFANNPRTSIPAYTPEVLAYSATDALYYGVRGVNQLMRKAGGIPYDNSATNFVVEVGTPTPLTYTDTGDASSYVANWATPGTSLYSRLLTLHTTDDPTVPFWHETGFGDLMSGSSNLAQQYAKRIGHCSLTQEELIVALDNAIRWGEGRISYPVDIGDVTSTIDEPPLASFASPTTSTVSGKEVTLSVDASDDIGVSRVEFYVGSSPDPLAVVPTTDKGQLAWSAIWDTTTSADGATDISAVVVAATPSDPLNPGSVQTTTVTTTVTVDNGTSPSNQKPIAQDDSASTSANTSVDINALANDSDPDGDPIALLAVSDPLNGSATIAEGIIRYTPETDFTGIESFSYTIIDGLGLSSDPATITVEVTGSYAFTLTATPTTKRNRQALDLRWDPHAGKRTNETVDLFIANIHVSSLKNDGSETYYTGGSRTGTEDVKICKTSAPTECSNTVAVTW